MVATVKTADIITSISDREKPDHVSQLTLVRLFATLRQKLLGGKRVDRNRGSQQELHAPDRLARDYPVLFTYATCG